MNGGRTVAVLPAQLRLDLLECVPRLHWNDGKSSARGLAAEVKDCEIAATIGDAEFSTARGARLLAETVQCLLSSAGFRDEALPLRLSALRFVRYRLGGSYGVHTDEALSGNGFRADLSFTILLQSATAGGKLHVGGEQVSMLEGDVFLYPSTTAHGVSTILEGERVVLVGWVESMVRRADRRALLAKLHEMVSNPAERQPTNIQAVRNELLRQWCG